MRVPFLDLKAQYETIRTEIDEALRRVIELAAFAGGPFVAEFEEKFATAVGADHAIGVSSGTSALWLALVASGVGPGDEVITVPNTFIATAEAVSFAGATPVFVDVDEATYTMDPALFARAITPRTKAVIPVHLFGQTADMDPITQIARDHRLLVIEDAAQAHGAGYMGRYAGSMGDAAAFSFYPGKNLGAFGEAGAVVTNDFALAERVRMLRDHGQERKYLHRMIGWNARMDGIQGAVLTVKLRHLGRWNDARRARASAYASAFEGASGIVTPAEAVGRRHVYHVFAVRVGGRDSILEALKTRDIHCGIHYPVPVHLQEAYRDLGLEEGSFPVAERCARELLSLPMFPELTIEQVAFVAEEVLRAVDAFGESGAVAA